MKKNTLVTLFLALLAITFFVACQKSPTIMPAQDLTFFPENRSCAFDVVYKYGQYKQDSITFEIRNYAKQLDTSKAFKLVIKKFDDPDAPEVEIKNYSNYVPFSYCPGIIPKDYNPIIKNTWAAQTGEISMQIAELLPTMGPFSMYKANFTLKNVALKNEKNELILIDKLILKEVFVGGLLPP